MLIGSVKAMKEDTIRIQDHDKWLVDSHLMLQKSVIYLAVPIALSFFLYRALSDSCWHNWALLVGFCLASVGFAFGLLLTRKSKLKSSVMVFSLSLISFEALAMLIFEDVAVTSLLGDMMVIIYASVFSRRILYINAMIAFLSFALSQIVRRYAIYPMKIMAPDERLTFLLFFSALLLIIIAVILRRTNLMQRMLVKSMGRMNEDQKSIIDTAGTIGNVVDKAVESIREASGTFATLVNDQATSAVEIDTAMRQIRRMARETASSADETQKYSESIKKKSEESGEQLESMEKSFVDIVMSNDMVRFEFANFASKAESIESILVANSEIAGQIKVLAVNAAIQAAKAGEWGAGFRVVARELKSLIQKTDDSLKDIRGLLEYIRVQAKQSTETIESNTKLLNQQLDEINAMRNLVHEISGAFISISELVKRIADAARQQQQRLDEVGTGIADMDTVASELRMSTDFLVESVNTIAKSHKSLLDLLSSN
jgi:methyl-accepting chemotaxis protein